MRKKARLKRSCRLKKIPKYKLPTSASILTQQARIENSKPPNSEPQPPLTRQQERTIHDTECWSGGGPVDNDITLLCHIITVAIYMMTVLTNQAGLYQSSPKPR